MGLGFCRIQSPLYSDFAERQIAEREIWTQLEGITRKAKQHSKSKDIMEQVREEALFCFSLLHTQHKLSASFIINRCRATEGIIQEYLHAYPRLKETHEDSLTNDSTFQNSYILDVFFGEHEEWRKFEGETLKIKTQQDLIARVFKCGFHLP